MKRFFLAPVCAAMVWLVPSLAWAELAYWDCSAKRYKVVDGKPMYRATLKKTVQAEDAPAAHREVLRQWQKLYGDGHEFVGLMCDKPAFSRKKLEDERKPAAPPPIPPAHAPKPANRTWTCRVKLRWHIGSRSGDVDETWSDIEAPTDSAARGIAIFRSQSRLKALSLKGTNPTWSKTDAECS